LNDRSNILLVNLYPIDKNEINDKK